MMDFFRGPTSDVADFNWQIKIMLNSDGNERNRNYGTDNSSR